VGRRDHVFAGECGTHARSGRFLSDRDVQEPRQLTSAEALLDLLLEAADEEHLAEEPAEHPVGHAATA
jgi:hypothetical protein